MNVLISCALPSEFNEARNQIGLKEITTKKDRPRIAHSKKITLICTGIGKINSLISLQSVISRLENPPDIIIDTGTCGALDEEHSIFDIVTTAKAIDFYNVEVIGSPYINNQLEKLNLLLPELTIGNEIIGSIETSIVLKSDKNKLLDNEVNIVTWETSSVFALAKKLDIPFFSIRVVTDKCDENTFRDFKANCSTGCKKLYNHVKNICKGI